jgi:hypothetical protein
MICPKEDDRPLQPRTAAIFLTDVKNPDILPVFSDHCIT